MFILTLILISSLKVSGSQVCDVRGEKYSPGAFINKCRKCYCNSDGSWNCNPQCPAEHISCPSGQKVTSVRREVLRGCFCDKLVCTADNNQAAVCDVNRELYSPGPFINKCRKCYCNSDGSWKCDPQCPSGSIVCSSGKKMTYIREEVLKGCFCNKLACITDQNTSKGCRLDEVTYPSGTFTHQCRSCICNSDGSWSCSPQCPTYVIKCGANENIRNVREEVSPGCFCEKPTCVNRD